MGMYHEFGDYEMKWSGHLAAAGKDFGIVAENGFVNLSYADARFVITYLADRLDSIKVYNLIGASDWQGILKYNRGVQDLTVLLQWHSAPATGPSSVLAFG